MPSSITIQNFATWPVGVAIIWAFMAVIDRAIPTMSTRVKVLTQLGVSALYAAFAAAFFLDGTVKALVQQGVILFLVVAFSQQAGYESATKLMGLKGSHITNKPVVTPPAPEPAPAPVTPPVVDTPVVVPPVADVPVTPVVTDAPVSPSHGDADGPAPVVVTNDADNNNMNKHPVRALDTNIYDKYGDQGVPDGRV